MKTINLITIQALLSLSGVHAEESPYNVKAFEDSILSAECAAYEEAIGALNSSLADKSKISPKVEHKVQFITSVYGDYMGHEQIVQTWNYLLSAEKDQDDSDSLTSFLEEWMVKWDRKSVLSLLTIYPGLSAEHKNETNKFVSKIMSNKHTLASLRADKKVLKFSEVWASYSIKKNNNQPVPYKLEKVLFKKGMDNVEVKMSDILTLTIVNGRRVLPSTGKIARVKGGIFDGISAAERKSARWSSVELFRSGFGRHSFIWKNSDKEGVVQILKGNNKDEGQDGIFLYYEGNTLPAPSNFVGGLDKDDIDIFISRAVYPVEDRLRSNEDVLVSSESICRYNSRIALSQIVGLLDEDKLKKKDVELYLFLNAHEISSGVFKKYPQLKSIITDYR